MCSHFLALVAVPCTVTTSLLGVPQSTTSLLGVPQSTTSLPWCTMRYMGWGDYGTNAITLTLVQGKL